MNKLKLLCIVMVVTVFLISGCASAEIIQEEYPEGGVLAVVGFNNEFWFDAKDVIFASGGYVVITYKENGATKKFETNDRVNKFEYHTKEEFEELKIKLGLK